MKIISDLIGTKLSEFRIKLASISSSSLTAIRTYTLPDKNITIAGLDDILPTVLSEAGSLAIEIGKLLYPVGAIYHSNVATNPATLLGFGTWVLHGAGRVGVCIDTAQTEFDTLGKTGGAKTHSLTSNEMPLHTHAFSETTTSDGDHSHKTIGGDAQRNSDTGTNWNKQGVDLTNNNVMSTTTNGAHTHTISGITSSAGSNAAHNNLQPYIVEYHWVRTA